MNKMIVAAAANKKIKDAAAVLTKTAEQLEKRSEETVTMSRKTFALEIAVALLGGIVLGMFLSPRKKVTYKIASNNRINSGEDDDGEDGGDGYYEEDDADGDDDDGRNGRFIKL